jgi:hypothetical protein
MLIETKQSSTSSLLLKAITKYELLTKYVVSTSSLDISVMGRLSGPDALK